MPQTTPVLDLIYLDSHDSRLLIIGDSSVYPSSWTISTPTIEITPPELPVVSMSFTAGSVQVFNSQTLNITTGDNCDNIPLPDGLYKIKYSIYPSYLYYVEKTFMRVDQLMAEFDKAYLKLDIYNCDKAMSYETRLKFSVIEDYINGAIAAGNNCANKLAMELYRKAEKMINKFSNNSSCSV